MKFYFLILGIVDLGLAVAPPYGLYSPLLLIFSGVMFYFFSQEK